MPEFKTRTILIIEDNENIRNMAVAYFAKDYIVL
jgi:hypothetical protein